MPKVIVENELTYGSLTPTALTSYKGIHLVNADVLKETTGSILAFGVIVNENLSPHQGTFWAWVYLDAPGNAGNLRYLFDAYIDSGNRISVYISAANNLVLDVIGGGTTRSATTSISSIGAKSWFHVAATWSKNNTVNSTNYLYIYLNAAGAGSTSAPVALASIPSTFSIGMDYNGKNNIGGYIAWKLTRMWSSSTEVSNQYAAGTGTTDFFTVTPHTVSMGTTTESSTSQSYHTRGKYISAIADGATEDTLTTSAGADTVFADNDRVIVSAGNGYNSNLIGNTFVDGTPSSTSVLVDDGTGADMGAIENVGRNINCNGLYYAQAASNTIHQITTEDFSFSIRIKSIAGIRYLFRKELSSPNNGYLFLYNTAAGKLQFWMGDGTDSYIIDCNSNLNDSKWHHITVTVDRDNATNCIVYVDGIAETMTKTGTITNIDSLTNNAIFHYGSDHSGGSILIGNFCDAKIAFVAWSAAEVLYQATHPYDISASAGTITEAYACNEGSGTTITASVTPASNNLTLSNVLAWNQSAFVSRNLFPNGNFENGNIGNLSSISGATVIANTITPIADSVDGKIINSGAAQGYVGQSIKTAANEDYYLYGLHKSAATPSGTTQLVDIDNDASKGITVNQAGASGATTLYEVEFCFQASDADTTIDLGTGSLTSGNIAYWDNVEVLRSYVINGSCEGGSNPPSGWTQEANATVVSASGTYAHAGAYGLQVTAGAAEVGAYQNITWSNGSYYTIIGYAKATSGDTAGIYVNTGTGVISTIGTTTSTTWSRIRESFKTTAASGVVYCRAVANGDIVYFDDIAIIRDDYAAANTITKGGGIIPKNLPYVLR